VLSVSSLFTASFFISVDRMYRMYRLLATVDGVTVFVSITVN
jgi:hypothetical protein